MEKIIKKFISQMCLGYSADFRQTHIESYVEFNDGTTGLVYNTNTRNEYETENIGVMKTVKPYVAVPVSEFKDTD